MRGKGVLQEHSQLGTSSRKNPARKGKVTKNAGNIDVIDLDSDNIVIIDGNECSHPKFYSPRVTREGRKFFCESIIDINDDESNVEDHVNGGGELDSDATSSKTSFPAFNYMENNVQSDGECHIVRENKSSVQFPKCKETHYAKVTQRNRYGLGSEFEFSLSDSDQSDCEIVEDSYGTLREQWEKASLKRKHVKSHQSGLEGQSSTSGSSSEINTNAEENRTEQYSDFPTFSSSSNANGCMEDHSLRPQNGNTSGEYGQKIELGSCSNVKPGVVDETDHFYQNNDFEPWRAAAEDPPINFEWQSPTDTGANSDAPPYPGGSFVDANNENNLRFKGSQPSFNDYDHRKSSVQEEEASIRRNMHEDHIKVVTREKDDVAQSNFNILSPNEDEGTFSEKKEKSVLEHVSNTRPFDGTQVCNSACFSTEKAYDGIPEVSSEIACYQDKIIKDLDEASLGASTSRESHAYPVPKKSFLDGATELYDTRDLSHDQGGVATPLVERDIISGREKLKETAEYKRVMEEEWASRQLELQIQAEEVKRLRKRKKAESMRILDMQRRQMQRVEEVRETQKKDEEKMNLKEQHRAEVRKELNRLEITCENMASLLCRLGIQVGGGASPMDHELNAAYKRALLKFHPDRASRTDIRQQVEAEEKFKLISRMKEKFLSTSCFR